MMIKGTLIDHHEVMKLYKTSGPGSLLVGRIQVCVDKLQRRKDISN